MVWDAGAVFEAAARIAGDEARSSEAPSPSLAFAQRPAPSAPGLHVMDSQTSSAVETVSALAAAHADLVLALSSSLERVPVPGHPMVPVAYAVVVPNVAHAPANANSAVDLAALDRIVARVAREPPRLEDFQIIRGPTGASA